MLNSFSKSLNILHIMAHINQKQFRSDYCDYCDTLRQQLQQSEKTTQNYLNNVGMVNEEQLTTQQGLTRSLQLELDQHKEAQAHERELHSARCEVSIRQSEQIAQMLNGWQPLNDPQLQEAWMEVARDTVVQV